MNGGPGGCGMLVISPEAEENHDICHGKRYIRLLFISIIFMSVYYCNFYFSILFCDITAFCFSELAFLLELY